MFRGRRCILNSGKVTIASTGSVPSSGLRSAKFSRSTERHGLKITRIASRRSRSLRGEFVLREVPATGLTLHHSQPPVAKRYSAIVK